MDGVFVQIPKKHTKRLLECQEEAWPTGNKRFRVSKLEPNSRTTLDVGCFNPVCAEGKEPARVRPWVDISQEQAAAHMQAGTSVALLGMGGTGKTCFANEQAQALTCRTYAVAKTHVAVAGLHIEGATKCTLAALQRRYVALGASRCPPSASWTTSACVPRRTSTRS